MTDNVSPIRRSEIMRTIKGKNTSPELCVRSLLHRMGYRFRLHVKDLPGHPDIVLPRRKKIIFVHGCFWHGHGGCNKAALPKSNTEFWSDKQLNNKRRDRLNVLQLKRLGWRALIIWQCELKQLDNVQKTLLLFLSSD